MHQKNIITAGKELNANSKVLIMIHGRGGSAEDILSLSSFLKIDDFALMAPQATNNAWYPYTFLAPTHQNEPWLSSALGILDGLVNEILGKGVSLNRIYFLGFSQGACLTLEYVSRHARRYGGVVAFTGGLIGDKVNNQNYKGDFDGTPVFLGTSDPDAHVPVERVYATTNILRNLGAEVTEKVYPNMGHTINQDEIDLANQIVFHS
ncbi:MAG TPA: dienelactone hydrolase family protein [Flavisolibacter sp.]